jgi:hypothetical protein
MYVEDILSPKPSLSQRANAKEEGIQALFVVSMGRVAVDGPITAIMREKARFTVGLGWNYKFLSNGRWLLIPIDQVVGVEFADEPKGIS